MNSGAFLGKARMLEGKVPPGRATALPPAPVVLVPCSPRTHHCSLWALSLTQVHNCLSCMTTNGFAVHKGLSSTTAANYYFIQYLLGNEQLCARTKSHILLTEPLLYVHDRSFSAWLHLITKPSHVVKFPSMQRTAIEGLKDIRFCDDQNLKNFVSNPDFAVNSLCDLG